MIYYSLFTSDLITIALQKVPHDVSELWQTRRFVYQTYYPDKQSFPTHFIYCLWKNLIFTQCSWQLDCSPQGGNLTVSQIFIVTLQMETLYYKLFHYWDVASLSFQINSNASTVFSKGRRIKFFWFGLEVFFRSTLRSLYSKSSQVSVHLCKIDFPLRLLPLIRLSFLCVTQM